MDNTPIHKRVYIQETVERLCYKCIYLAPYSSEFNPIEKFWSVAKSKRKRYAILEEQTLQGRISGACREITQRHLYDFVKHSHSRLEGCLNKKAIQILFEV